MFCRIQAIILAQTKGWAWIELFKNCWKTFFAEFKIGSLERLALHFSLKPIVTGLHLKIFKGSSECWTGMDWPCRRLGASLALRSLALALLPLSLPWGQTASAFLPATEETNRVGTSQTTVCTTRQQIAAWNCMELSGKSAEIQPLFEQRHWWQVSIAGLLFDLWKVPSILNHFDMFWQCLTG